MNTDRQNPVTSLMIVTTDLNPWESFSRPLHIKDASGKTLCGKSLRTKDLKKADWDTLHLNMPHGRPCKCCREKAVLILRPEALFWYLDPFNGGKKQFQSQRKATLSAQKEHGTSTIWQLGPGDINKIVKTVHGLDPLP